MDKRWLTAVASSRTPQELYKNLVRWLYPREKMQVPKRQTAYTYLDGPMIFLGRQIVKGMEDAGYPAKILYGYRSPEGQAELYAKGRTKSGNIVTKAKPYQSPHQYYEAVDIVHPSKFWDVSEAYWDTLASVVRIVAEKYGVELNHGHHWDFRDSAHIELKDWRLVRERIKVATTREGLPMRPPTRQELGERFHEVLPKVAKAYERRSGGKSLTS